MTGTAQHGGFAIELGGAGGRPPLCHITGGAAAPWGGSPEGGQGPQGGAGLGRGEPFVAGPVAPCGTRGQGSP